MKHSKTAFGAAALFSTFLVFTSGACGGQSNDAPVADAGTHDSATPTTVPDAAPDGTAANNEAGVAPSCSTTSNCAAGFDCCITLSAPTSGQCVTSGTCSGAALGCTSSASCTGGLVCCGSITGSTSGSTSCQTAPCGNFQLCASSAECPTGQICETALGYGICTPPSDDGGTEDAGPTDGGSSDASSTDAGATDASTDGAH